MDPCCFDTTPTRVGWDGSVLDPLRPVAEARCRARVWVRERWQLPELVDSVELAAGELCANAVRHGGGLAGLELVLGRGGRRFAPPSLRVVVVDREPGRVPQLALNSDPLGESGRGLRLVEAVSRRWGWHRAGCGEKSVWCTFAV
ncbi:ATP-binding protein [Streptomyces sp. NPDC002172]